MARQGLHNNVAAARRWHAVHRSPACLTASQRTWRPATVSFFLLSFCESRALPARACAMSLSVLFCLVVAVSDGDTLTARCGRPGAYQQLKVRVAAIDAPELGQAHGQASRRQLVQLCMGERARIDPVERDRYGRTVAHVRCGDTDVASEQVRTGMAWVYSRYAGSRPQLAPLERRARAGSVGLWAQRRPLPPWTYRHRYPQRPQHTQH